jgi:hypothetical protein
VLPPIIPGGKRLSPQQAGAARAYEAGTVITIPAGGFKKKRLKSGGGSGGGGASHY